MNIPIESLRDLMKEVAGKAEPKQSSVKNKSGRLAHYGDRKFLLDKIAEVEAKNGGNDNAWIYDTNIVNDLKKVRFGKSKINSGWGDFSVPGVRLGLDDLDEKNKLTVLWAAACGFKECPVVFAVYVDNHNHLRAYIPEDGNVYDKKQKCALPEGSPQTYDMEKLRKAAIDRIQVDPNTKPKKKVSKKKKPSPVHKKPNNNTIQKTNTMFANNTTNIVHATKGEAWEFIEAIRELNGKSKDKSKTGHHWISELSEFVNSNLFTPISIKTSLTIYFNTETWIGLGGYDDVDDWTYGNVSEIQKYFGPIIAGPEKLSNGSIIVWGSIFLKDDLPDKYYCPFAFILYLDTQRTLHAYIPSAGNFYDHNTNLPYISKNQYCHGTKAVFDMDAMRNEFLANVSNLRISPPKPNKKVNSNNQFDLLTLDWTTVPNLTDGMEECQIDDLNDFQNSWKKSANPLKDEAAKKFDKWLCNPKDIKQWTSFQKGIEDAAGGYDWWVNPAYANLKPSTVKVGQKEIVSCGGADYLIDIFFDQSNGTLIGYIFDVD